MSAFHNDLNKIGYSKVKPSLASMHGEMHHEKNLHDSKHRQSLDGVLEKHGYQAVPSAHLHTWVHKENDDDSVVLQPKREGKGHRLFHDKGGEEANESINEVAYPMTYIRPHKDGNTLTHYEVKHTHIDMGQQDGKTPERVGTLVKRSPQHQALVKQGFSIHTYGEHKTPKDYYTTPVKLVEDIPLNTQEKMQRWAQKQPNKTKEKTMKATKTLKEMFALVEGAGPTPDQVRNGTRKALQNIARQHGAVYKPGTNATQPEVHAPDGSWSVSTELLRASNGEAALKFHAKTKDGKHASGIDHKDVLKQVGVIKEEVELNEAWDKMSHESRELVMAADSDRDLYHQSLVPIKRNLQKKHEKGVYDHDKAKSMWMYHADRAAHSYARQYGDKDTPWHKQFPTSVRREAAAHWADVHRDNMKHGVD